MRIKSFAVAIGILSTSGPASAVTTPLLTPTGPWNVEYADKMCLLIRPYGVDRSTHLILKPAMLGNDLEIVVTKATSRIGDATDGKVILSIDGNAGSATSRFRAYSTKTHRFLRIWNEEDRVPLATVRGTLQIDAKSAGRYAFALPGIDKALPVVNDCLTQLRKAYRISPEDLAAIATEPQANMARVFSTNDYPEEALRKGLGGTVGTLVWVEATGLVSSCEVVESTAAPVLDKTTCDIITRRLRFKPAMDAAGRAVRAPDFGRVRWIP
jgi:TonB family protein